MLKKLLQKLFPTQSAQDIIAEDINKIMPTLNYVAETIVSEDLVNFIKKYRIASAKFDRGTFATLLSLKDGHGAYLVDTTKSTLCGINFVVVDELTHPFHYHIKFTQFLPQKE